MSERARGWNEETQSYQIWLSTTPRYEVTTPVDDALDDAMLVMNIETGNHGHVALSQKPFLVEVGGDEYIKEYDEVHEYLGVARNEPIVWEEVE